MSVMISNYNSNILIDNKTVSKNMKLVSTVTPFVLMNKGNGSDYKIGYEYDYTLDTIKPTRYLIINTTNYDLNLSLSSNSSSQDVFHESNIQQSQPTLGEYPYEYEDIGLPEGQATVIDIFDEFDSKIILQSDGLGLNSIKLKYTTVVEGQEVEWDFSNYFLMGYNTFKTWGSYISSPPRWYKDAKILFMTFAIPLVMGQELNDETITLTYIFNFGKGTLKQYWTD